MSFQLSQGTLVQVSPSLVKRRKTHFHNLPCGASIILGNNGYVWISPTVNEDTENTGGFIENHEVRLSMIVYIHWCWAGSFSRSEVLSYLYLPFTLFLSLFLRGIQLAKVIVFDQIGRIKALAYMSTVPHPEGQSRIFIRCPAVPRNQQMSRIFRKWYYYFFRCRLFYMFASQRNKVTNFE